MVTIICVVSPFLASETFGDDWQPWDALEADSWIGPAVTTYMYPVNAAQNWTIEFNDAPLSSHQAKGMNALRFEYGGQNIGHLLTTKHTGSFNIRNFSGSKTYNEVLLLVVVDDVALPEDFSLSLSAHEPNQWDVTLTGEDFVYYHQPDYDTGRPSGYYSYIDPNSESLASVFDIEAADYYIDPNGPRCELDRGVITVVELADITLAYGGGSVSVYYEFENLSSTAAFSVYSGQGHIVSLTNRVVIDQYAPEVPCSTFEVIPLKADLDGDGDVDMADLSRFINRWPDGPCVAPSWCGQADFGHSGKVDLIDFSYLARFWLTGPY